MEKIDIVEIWWNDLAELIGDTESDIRDRYIELYRILCDMMNEVTGRTGLMFSGPFARLTYLSREYGIDKDLSSRVNAFRSLCKNLRHTQTDLLNQHLLSDVRDVADFIAQVSGTTVPDTLSCLLPNEVKVWKKKHTKISYIRVAVENCDSKYIYATTEDHEEEHVKVDYTNENNFYGNWQYVGRLVKPGSQLNLIRPIRKDDVYIPELIIFEPDYLIDISSLASCFEEYGASPYNYLLKRLTQMQDNYYTLLGDIAGQILDEEINTPLKNEYIDSARTFFRSKPMSIVTAITDSKKFHTNAKEQQQNIRNIITLAKKNNTDFDLEHIILEPSFFCEMLGIQGRMDLLHDEYKVLMEQKSGSKDFKTQNHQEKHYVQMLLYLALLHYTFDIPNDQIASYLMYSKYQDGLMQEGPAPHLLFEALKLRNQVVWNEYYLGQGGVKMLDTLTLEKVNVKGADNTYLRTYIFPELQNTLDTIQSAPSLVKDYFYRMFTFVKREHILTKVGSSHKEASGLASLWNCTTEEKKLAGNILEGLVIKSIADSDSDTNKYNYLTGTVITLAIPECEDNYIPNFRESEPVILYRYTNGEIPDARRGIVFRGSIEEMKNGVITIRLRSEQHNHSVFRNNSNTLWAMESDFMESSYSTLYRGLFAFLDANEDRRDLVLSQRQPRRDEGIALNGDYGTFNELVLHAKQAQDYFIVIGPPGTGKTSFGMLNILKEALTDVNNNVLLMSYTNRAVDEICSKLVAEKIDFIRIGSHSSCPDTYKPYMLENKISQCSNADAIRSVLTSTKVYVGTTTSVSGKQTLFCLKHFTLAIIDEASQILEPHLLPLLSAKHKEGNAIDRFVLIGDHKQLPAVVQQTAEEAEVKEEALRLINLTNCRNSLFERLLSYHEADTSPFVYRLTRQGRMHHDVADFSCTTFYENKLQTVPLQHQEAPIQFQKHADTGMEQLIATHRTAFIPVAKPTHSASSKVNQPEAAVIADLVHSAWLLYKKNGIPFLTDESVGVIVPYRNQIAMVRSEIDKYGIAELHDITIDTVERYQGSERDIIIYGFTVQYEYQLRFLTSNVFMENGHIIDRKLNVALTRAREHNIIVGNPDLLSRNAVFKKLIEYHG